jgi:hypothetical protein
MKKLLYISCHRFGFMFQSETKGEIATKDVVFRILTNWMSVGNLKFSMYKS